MSASNLEGRGRRFVEDEVQTRMDLKEFKYELPASLIAAYPSHDRQTSRLLIVKRNTGDLIHSQFSQLGTFLDPGDLLVARALPGQAQPVDCHRQREKEACRGQPNSVQ